MTLENELQDGSGSVSQKHPCLVTLLMDGKGSKQTIRNKKVISNEIFTLERRYRVSSSKLDISKAQSKWLSLPIRRCMRCCHQTGGHTDIAATHTLEKQKFDQVDRSSDLMFVYIPDASTSWYRCTQEMAHSFDRPLTYSTLLTHVPIPSRPTSTMSPSLSHNGGFLPDPTPCGLRLGQ